MATATAPVFDVPGYKIATAPDLSRPETRTRLSPTALKVFFAIVEEWRLSMSQAADLLANPALVYTNCGVRKRYSARMS